MEILEQEYASSDIINLQEVSTALINLAKASTLGKLYYHVKKEVFPKDDAHTEITSKVTENFPEGVKVPVANGDILAIAAEDKNNVEYVLASFYGDTNGLVTILILDNIKKTMITSSKILENLSVVWMLILMKRDRLRNKMLQRVWRALS